MEKKILFKLKDMEIDKPQIFEVKNDSSVSLKSVIFQRGSISRIEFVKCICEGERLFIQLFIGNINIANVVSEKDYVMSIDGGIIINYWIREAEKFD